MNLALRLSIFALFALCTAAFADDGFVAGLRPHERPRGAPAVERFEPEAAWRANALRGIGEPQVGLGFLKDQGVWYTPFTRPNLLGRYDIRGLHRNDNNKD